MASSDLGPLLSKLSQELDSGGLMHLERLPARPAVRSSIEPPLPAQLGKRLASMGISELWSHQAEALSHIREGRNTVISTGTASGKSLCFNLAVFESIIQDRRSRALYLYPTKALAQDQLRAIRSFAIPAVTAATYDGDTPFDERTSVRKFARVVLSNPDMLHFGILPRHSQWGDFFSNLRFVVIDEAHVLRGVFGSHVGCILRRLRRIARHHGANPTFVMTSATMGDPSFLAEKLIGEPFEEIVEDGSPKGDRLLAFWNPPWQDSEQGVRGSGNWEAARLMATLVDLDIHTLTFCKSRRSAELVAGYSKGLSENPGAIRSYRSGYLVEERRQIEQALFSGELKGVAATTALELGIDVGGLDAVVMNGFPGTISSFWQQSGRAGRSGEESIAVFIGADDPLDQYYMNHPDIMLGKAHEVALVDTTNPNILEPHLGSAAFELPIGPDEVDLTFGVGASETAERMIQDGKLTKRKRKDAESLHWAQRQPPAKNLDIRSVGGAAFSIIEAATGALIGSVDGARALKTVHPGAVYLHQGEHFLVDDLDLEERVALVSSFDGSYYTYWMERSNIKIEGISRARKINETDFYVGKVVVSEQVVGFTKRSVSTNEVIGMQDLYMPEQTLPTVAVWYTVPDPLQQAAGIAGKLLGGSIHAAEHAAIGMLPAFAMADRWDIGGLSTDFSPDTGMATVFVYDGYPGGVGIAQRGFDAAEDHLAATLEVIRDCPCEAGCPSCVQSPKCGNGNEPLDKGGAARLLRHILG
jgi:DEAD/DEAH box helicase domain-containing protein